VAVALRNPDWWLAPLRWALLAVWVAIPVFLYFGIGRPVAAQVLWSVCIAGLPLFILLIGYHRWRRVCPLAVFSQIPIMLRRPGTRRASPWLEENYYFIIFGLLLAGLWLRLTFVNGVGQASAVFLFLISCAAMAAGAIFTGKTWCNYLCPVSLIEKINTEPSGLRQTPSSQCAKCTACKKACPDINEENGYWKEMGLRSKRAAYFAFPGLTLAFYLYFYLQSGTWDYYFDGGWVDEPELIHRAFRPDGHPMSHGFFFGPALPRAAASFMTLAAGALLSFALFSWLERRLRRALAADPDADEVRVRHLLFTAAAFVSFLIFYAFAGQPLLRGVRWLGTAGGICAAVVGTLFLARRYGRTRKAFAEQSLALSIVKRWEWPDVRAPKDLHEALLIHQARSSERSTGYAQVLEVYKDAIREILADGLVTREEFQRLQSLRNQLQIKNSDHEKIMASLAQTERALLSDPSRERPSAEKLLQLQTYRRALEQHIKLAPGIDDRLLRQLQREYNVTGEEHAAQLDAILGGAQGIAAQVADELRRDGKCRQVIRALAAEPSPTHVFIGDLLRRQRSQGIARLMRTLHVDPHTPEGRPIFEDLAGNDEAARGRARATLLAGAAPGVTELIPREVMGAGNEAVSLVEGLRDLAGSPDPYVRAAAVYGLLERGAGDAGLLRGLDGEGNELARETLEGLRTGRTTTLEKMIALRSAPIFASIDPESLAGLARSSAEESYAPDQILVIEGDPGEDAFIILSGSIRVVLQAGTAHEVLVSERPAGDILGEMAVLDPAPRSATLRAGAGGVRVLAISGATLREALRSEPDVATGIIRTLVRRLRAALGQVDKKQAA
jgi:hypothetical protein